MIAENKRFGKVGLVLFTAGVLLSLLFVGLAIWGDMEAALFDASIREDTSIKSFHCPILITTREEGIVRAVLSNPSDREVERYVQTNISDGHVTLMRRVITRLPLAPGESKELGFEVFPEDAAYDRIIFARTRVLRAGSLPSESSACGIIVVDLPGFSGGQITGFLLVGGTAGMVSGWLLWFTANRPLRGKKTHLAYAMLLLMLVLIFGIAVGLLAVWILALVALVIALFIIVEMLFYNASQS